MHTKPLVFTVVLALAAASTSRADVYMSAGKTIYEFNLQGQLVNQADIDSNNYSAEGLTIGPDNRLYAAVAFGNHRVDSFSLNLGNHVTGFVQNGQGGLFVPYGNAFGGDGNLYVAGNFQSAVDRFFGPPSIVPAPGSNNPSAGNSGAVWSSSVVGPIGLAFTPDGRLYGSSQAGANGTVYLFDPVTGAPTSVATDLLSLGGMGGLAINAAGTQLFVRDISHILQYAIHVDHTLNKTADFNETGVLDSSNGLTFGPDGFLYATTRTGPVANGTFIERIDPNTGSGTSFVTGNLNTFTNSQNPSFLVFAPVPEPGTLTLSVIGGAIGLAAWRRRRAAKK